MVCLRNICINALHKGDNDDDNNDDDGDDDNNNNNNNIAYFIEQSPWEVHRFSVSQEILRIVESVGSLLCLQEPASCPCS